MELKAPITNDIKGKTKFEELKQEATDKIVPMKHISRAIHLILRYILK